MSSQIRRSNCLESSLDFQKEFTYIQMVREDVGRDRQRLHLKLLSKISKPLPAPPAAPRRPAPPRSPSRHRNKTKTRDKSLSHRRLPDSHLPPRPLPSRRDYKTLEPRTNENRVRPPPKTSRQPLNKNNLGESCKRFPKKKKPKEAALGGLGKEEGWGKRKGPERKKVGKMRSEKGLDRLTVSEMSRQEKRGQREEKVIQEYFGMTEKLSSILEEKSTARLERDKSKLSKCKTHSSSSSLRFNKPKNKR